MVGEEEPNVYQYRQRQQADEPRRCALCGLPLAGKAEKGCPESEDRAEMQNPSSKVMQPGSWPKDFPGDRVVELPEGTEPVGICAQVEELAVEPLEELAGAVEDANKGPVSIIIDQAKGSNQRVVQRRQEQQGGNSGEGYEGAVGDAIPSVVSADRWKERSTISLAHAT